MCVENVVSLDVKCIFLLCVYIEKVWKPLVSEDALTQTWIIERLIKGQETTQCSAMFTWKNIRKHKTGSPFSDKVKKKKKDYLESA